MKKTHYSIAAALILMGVALAQTITVTPWNETIEKIPVVTPGKTDSDSPSDAVKLFVGKNLDQWVNVKNGGPATWKVENGYAEILVGGDSIRTKEKFGSCQLHLEWATPEDTNKNGQARGNSGVYLMSLYEIQILDNYEHDTYKIGYAGAVYGQSPLEFNVCRKPGQWQTYDIIFHAPKFEGKVCTQPATVTLLHNGVLIHDNFQIQGVATWRGTAKYTPHGELPLQLQNHGSPVRFRNIWIRPLKDD